MTAHTPGPWTVKEDHPSNACVNICANSDEVATLYHASGDCYNRVNGAYVNQDIRAANARLIAAAPELLEALRNMIPAGWDDGTMDHMPAIKQARLAIAKATQP